MKHDLDTALDDCLTKLQAGIDVDECLSLYPDHAETLRPLLDLATAVQDLPAPQARPAAVQANLDRMMAAAAQRQAYLLPISKPFLSRYTERISTVLTGKKKKEGKDRGFLMRFATAAIAAVIALGAVGMGTATLASANSLPGDALYPIKRTVENVQLSLLDEAARQQFQAELEVRRRNEVQAVIQERRQVEVQFGGTLTAFDGSQWVVSGLTILVDAQTRIQGKPAAGLRVHVLAVTQADGSILARQLVVPGGTPGGQGPRSSPGPHGTGTPQPQGTPQQNRYQESTSTPEPKGTQTQQQATGTPQSSPSPAGTQEQQRNRPQPHGTPEATHTPESTATPGQQQHRPQPTSGPQATPRPTKTQNKGGR